MWKELIAKHYVGFSTLQETRLQHNKSSLVNEAGGFNMAMKCQQTDIP
jgi:hypothetical protein